MSQTGNEKETSLGRVQGGAPAVADSSAGAALGSFDYERAVAELTPEQVAECEKLTSGISLDSVHSIQAYGQDVGKVISKQADELLARASASKTTDTVELTNQLLSEINDMPTAGKDESGLKSFLRSLPIVRNIVKSVQKASIRSNTVEQNVEEISKKFESLKVVAMTNNASLEDMKRNTMSYIAETRKRIVAVMLLKRRAEAEVDDLRAAGSEDVDALRSRQNALSALSKKITDMAMTEHILKQNINQIAGMMGNNDSIIQKADLTVSQVIPIWKQQLAIGLMMDDQEISAATERKMEEKANQMLVMNARRMNTTSVEIARQNEDPFFKIDTLQETTRVMIDTVRQVKDIHDSGEQRRDEILRGIKELNDELADTLRS